MRASRLFALAATAAAALASSPATAHPPTLAGTPLLELQGQGLQRTLQAIPNCGIPPFLFCDHRNPRFASWHVLIFTDGRASVSITHNALEDAAGARTETVLGAGEPTWLRLLREALAEAQIGVATGGCRVSSTFPTPGANDEVEVLDLDWRVTWYGRGNRIARLTLPASGPSICPHALGDVVHWAVRYADSVLQAATSP